MRIESLQVQGYKALVDVTIPLQPLTVMIGPNGCGKTSVLEICQLLKAGAQNILKETISGLGGVTAIASKIEDNRPRIKIAVATSEIPPEPSIAIEYSFTLGFETVGYIIERESISSPSGKLHPYYIWENRNLLELEWWPQDIGDQAAREQDIDEKTPFPEQFIRSFLRNITAINVLDVTSRSPIRLPQALSPSKYPGHNGENVFSVLYNLREAKNSRKFFDRIKETISIAFSGFDHFELPVVGGGQITLAWHEQNLTQPLYPNQLSEGTLRFLWLTTLLLSPEPPPLILIDEPEISLHPELLKILAALLQDASTRTQIIVATQSADLIRWLSPEEIIILDKEDGKTKVTPATDPTLNLTAWLNDYSLADLWLMGNLEGRP